MRESEGGPVNPAGREENSKWADHSRGGNGWRPFLWDEASTSVAAILGFAKYPPARVLASEHTTEKQHSET